MRALLLALLLFAGADHACADPKTDYLLYCRGCHLANGEGVPPEVPTLHELGKLIATPAGREYIVRVPGVSQTPMSDERLAAVLNWVLDEFNAGTLASDFRRYTAKEVGGARKEVLVDPLAARAALLQKKGSEPNNGL